LDRGYIFADPLAVSILGEDADAIDREAESDPSRRRLRMFIAVRARFAEDAGTERDEHDPARDELAVQVASLVETFL
jgi:hypothetical protein